MNDMILFAFGVIAGWIVVYIIKQIVNYSKYKYKNKKNE